MVIHISVYQFSNSRPIIIFSFFWGCPFLRSGRAIRSKSTHSVPALSLATPAPRPVPSLRVLSTTIPHPCSAISRSSVHLHSLHPSAQFTNLPKFFIRKLQVFQRIYIVLKLFHRAGTHYHRTHLFAVEAPGQGHLRQRLSA